MNRILAIAFFFMLFNGASAFTQTNPTDTNTYVIKKNNGVEYIGKILSDDGREVLILTESMGKIYIPKADITLIKVVDVNKEIVNNEYRGKGVFTTRYQFSTNAFPIEKGENYAMINLYGPEVHFAVNKRFSLGIMASWIASPLVLAAKYTIPTSNEKINFGIGTLLGTTGYLNQARGFGGLHWGMVSFGDRSKNITFSIGYSYLSLGVDYEQVIYQPGKYYPVVDQWDNSYIPNPTVQSINKVNDPLTTAPILGIAGIAPVGKKASFICDAMLLFGSRTQTNYSQNQTIIYNSQGQQDYLLVDPALTTTEKSSSVNLIFMPGLRFQKTENKAFQISLAGIIGRNEMNSYSFPLPMCSWFYKF